MQEAVRGGFVADGGIPFVDDGDELAARGFHDVREPARYCSTSCRLVLVVLWPFRCQYLQQAVGVVLPGGQADGGY